MSLEIAGYPFKAEKDLLQEAVLTTMVRNICKMVTRFRKASLSVPSSPRTLSVEVNDISFQSDFNHFCLSALIGKDNKINIEVVPTS